MKEGNKRVSDDALLFAKVLSLIGGLFLGLFSAQKLREWCERNETHPAQAILAFFLACWVIGVVLAFGGLIIYLFGEFLI